MKYTITVETDSAVGMVLALEQLVKELLNERQLKQVTMMDRKGFGATEIKLRKEVEEGV